MKYFSLVLAVIGVIIGAASLIHAVDPNLACRYANIGCQNSSPKTVVVVNGSKKTAELPKPHERGSLKYQPATQSKLVSMEIGIRALVPMQCPPKSQ